MEKRTEANGINLALAPVIQSIEICRDEEDLPRHLRLRGYNLQTASPSQVIIDGTFSSGTGLDTHQSSAEALVRIPDPRVFKHTPAHQVIYTTPYGIAIKRF